MKSCHYEIRFLPWEKTVTCPEGQNFMEAALYAGIQIDAPCGGEGTCGKCRIQFVSGAPDPTGPDRTVFSDRELEKGWRLACCALPAADAVVEVPESSLLSSHLQIMSGSERPGRTEFSRDFPNGILAAGEKNTGIAIDVGTTTLAGELFDLDTGRILAVDVLANPQICRGDDVISRIKMADSRKGGQKQLHEDIVGGIDKLVSMLLSAAGEKAGSLRAVTFAGNTTMQHLLCNLDISGLARIPFQPCTLEPFSATAGSLGLKNSVNAEAWVMPVIGGFVGGDTVAGIISTSLDGDGQPRMMLDIGTNGEIVLSCNREIHAASTAAGPALEGARISCGMRAAGGAIERVKTTDENGGDIEFEVIGGEQPRGICGSGLIDILAVLLDTGIVDSTGRMLEANEVHGLSPGMASRISRNSLVDLEFVLAGDSESKISFTSRDVREMQLAIGAIRAGAGILQARAGIGLAEIKQFLIAGGFGGFIRRENALRVGLIPEGIPADIVEYVGNVSLHGAGLVLFSETERKKAMDAANRTEHVDLSADPSFQAAFSEAMIFPVFSPRPDSGPT